MHAGTQIAEARLIDRGAMGNDAAACGPPYAAAIGEVILIAIARPRFLVRIVDVIEACIATGAEFMERSGHQASSADCKRGVFEASLQAGMRSIAVFRMIVGNSP